VLACATFEDVPFAHGAGVALDCSAAIAPEAKTANAMQASVTESLIFTARYEAYGSPST